MPDHNTFSRRAFLQSAAAAVCAPIVVPASALGRDGHTPPGNRITIGLIGCGKIANMFHLPTLLQVPEVQIVAVCDADSNRREHAKSTIEAAYKKANRSATACKTYRDYRELLARRDIDAVLIATPEHWHATMVIDACKAGKDIYCEKPLTHTFEESKRVIAAVRKHKRVLQTGTQQRSNGQGHFREACEIVRSGRLGRIKTVQVGVGAPSKWCDLPKEASEPNLDWNLWLGCAPNRPYNSILSPRGVHDFFPMWRLYREYSGGMHADICAHHYDIAQWALDFDRTGPVDIIPPANPASGTGMRYVYANGVEIVHGGPGAAISSETREHCTSIAASLRRSRTPFSQTSSTTARTSSSSRRDITATGSTASGRAKTP